MVIAAEHARVADSAAQPRDALAAKITSQYEEVQSSFIHNDLDIELLT